LCRNISRESVNRELRERGPEVIGVLDELGETLQPVLADVTGIRLRVGKCVADARGQGVKLGGKCRDPSICCGAVRGDKRVCARHRRVMVHGLVGAGLCIICGEGPHFSPFGHLYT
jgi:hypothetical protein